MKSYPPTHHCVPPNEDRTNKSLCRPLPTIYKPPPPPPAKPGIINFSQYLIIAEFPVVVGSATWVNAKTDTSPSTGPVLQGAWGRGRGGINLSTRTGGTNPMAPPSRCKCPHAVLHGSSVFEVLQGISPLFKTTKSHLLLLVCANFF